MFSCKFYKSFKDTFTGRLQATASERKAKKTMLIISPIAFIYKDVS